MRLRNVKGSREQIAANEYTIKDAEQIKGQWKDYFQDGKPIQLEIGMGKGKFLMQLAEKNPQIHYIGIEKYSSGFGQSIRENGRESFRESSFYSNGCREYCECI